MEQQIIELRENFLEKLDKETPSDESKYKKKKKFFFLLN